MTRDQKRLLYKALLGHDGRTLRPDWPTANQDKLTLSLDALRSELFDFPLLDDEVHEARLPAALIRAANLYRGSNTPDST